jgi:glycosyltransferase involved in cell wall biosynthesis
MKIAFVSLMKILPWGGSEDLWYKAAKLALNNGHEVWSLTQRWGVTPDKILELNRLGGNTLFYDDPSTSLISKVASRLKLSAAPGPVVPPIEADVYIISNGSTWDFIRFRQLVEYFITRRTPYILISQHGFEHGDIVDERARAYAIQVIQQAVKFFFVAERNLEVAQRQLAACINNAQLISNPLNTRSRVIKAYPSSPTLLMACVARLECDVKGQDVLLHALSNEQWRTRDFKLKFYGTGPHFNYLQMLINLYGLQDKATLEGHVSDVDQIWETNQVLVLPSFNEGTPLSLLEATMAGRAALATDVGDNGRYVLPGKTGILIDTASINCLRAGLEELWRNREQLEMLGQQAFHHTLSITDFHPEKTLLDYIESLA